MEDWRVIPGYKGEYWVSSEGQVISIKERSFNRWVKAFKKPSTMANGYLMTVLYADNKPSHRTVHTLVARAFIGEPVGTEVVDHIDGDKTNNRLENLRYLPRGENGNRGKTAESHKKTAAGIKAFWASQPNGAASSRTIKGWETRRKNAA